MILVYSTYTFDYLTCVFGNGKVGNTSFLLTKQAILVNYHAYQVHMTNILHGSGSPFQLVDSTHASKHAHCNMWCTSSTSYTLNALILKYRTWGPSHETSSGKGTWRDLNPRFSDSPSDTVTYKLLLAFFWIRWTNPYTCSLFHVNDWGELAVSYKWIGWVWGITSWSSKLQENYRLFWRNL